MIQHRVGGAKCGTILPPTIELESEGRMPAQIIVLENDAASRELISYLLTMSGHAVCAVGTPVQAMQHLASAIPDLIITDLHLDRAMDGYAFGRWCRNESHLV